jgi:hypothetical protein
MWRAHLADGQVVDHDGSNTILPFVDSIVRFEVIGRRGRVTVEPPFGHRVVFCKERAGGPGVQAVTTAYKVGLLDRTRGLIVEGMRIVDGEPRPEEPVEFDQAVIALYEAA